MLCRKDILDITLCNLKEMRLSLQKCIAISPFSALHLIKIAWSASIRNNNNENRGQDIEYINFHILVISQ